MPISSGDSLPSRPAISLTFARREEVALTLEEVRTRSASRVMAPILPGRRRCPHLPLSGDSPGSGTADIVCPVDADLQVAGAKTGGGLEIRAIRRCDYGGWRPLWDGYNAFYGRSG